MGRTVLPFSQVLEERRAQFSKFRRALRAEDQQALDALFEQARLHIQAAVYHADPDPAEAFFLSVLIENWKAIDDLQTQLQDLKQQVQSLKEQHDDTAA